MQCALGRRPAHDDEAGAVQVLDKALGDDVRHDLVGFVDALPAADAQREGEQPSHLKVAASGEKLCALPAQRPAGRGPTADSLL